jgi:hypothetical protein
MSDKKALAEFVENPPANIKNTNWYRKLQNDLNKTAKLQIQVSRNAAAAGKNRLAAKKEGQPNAWTKNFPYAHKTNWAYNLEKKQGPTRKNRKSRKARRATRKGNRKH